MVLSNVCGQALPFHFPQPAIKGRYELFTQTTIYRAWREQMNSKMSLQSSQWNQVGSVEGLVESVKQTHRKGGQGYETDCFLEDDRGYYSSAISDCGFCL
jgi:hypothetical protein